MAKRKDSNDFLRNRRPIIAVVCEGRNSSEQKYFSHFKAKGANYPVVKVVTSESTDIKNMVKKAKHVIDENCLNNEINNDKLFIVADVDLSDIRYNQIKEARRKLKNHYDLIDFVLSNPCLEIWFLFHFTKDPKIERSSQKVKDQLRKYVPQYKETFDIYKKCKLQNKTNEAIANAECKNQMYDETTPILKRNPYTEIPNLMRMILNIKN